MEFAEQLPFIERVWCCEFGYYIGDINPEASRDAVEWINKSAINGFIKALNMNKEEWHKDVENIDLILDCLLKKFAPKMAQIALELDAHYVNLTEYVAETKK